MNATVLLKDSGKINASYMFSVQPFIMPIMKF